jgi:hypothetical protein
MNLLPIFSPFPALKMLGGNTQQGGKFMYYWFILVFQQIAYFKQEG